MLIFISSVGHAQICPAPVVDQKTYGLSGIGDGCTIKQGVYIPDVAYFKGTFTSSCDRHDKCLTQIGNKTHDCNSEFYGNMRNACDDKYSWLQPLERMMCRTTAYEYYRAVEVMQTEELTRTLQRASITASRRLAIDVNSDKCGTTPERTQLYSSNFVNEINATFRSLAGRLPTIYEFFVVANTYSYVDQLPEWRTNLVRMATSYAAFPPPAISYTTSTSDGLTLSADSLPADKVLWKLNYGSFTGRSLSLFEAPMYNRKYNVQGFLQVTRNGVRNMLVIDRDFGLIGWCASRAGLSCY